MCNSIVENMIRFILNLRKKYSADSVRVPNDHNDRDISVRETGINSRIENIYGQENIFLQRLYEKWTVRDTWLIKKEGLPLILGHDPDGTEYNSTDTAAEELWDHAQKCVEKGLLKVSNREQSPDFWKASPVDIFQWATLSRIEIPEILNDLMTFVVNTIKTTGDVPEPDSSNQVARSSQEDDQINQREAVLGMALAILAADSKKCRDNYGRIQVQNLVNLIEENHSHWTGKNKTGISTGEITGIITKWLNTVPGQ